MKRKNYELAYQDKLNGMTYVDIATKYKVTKAAVQSWQRRYWHDWDDSQDSQDE